MENRKERPAGAHMGPPIEEAKISIVDVCIVASVLICLLTSQLLTSLGVRYPMGEMRLEILQRMTAPISCLLVCQKETKLSVKAGMNRLKLTAAGAGVGIVIALIDTVIYNTWLECILVAAGVLLSLYLCKLIRLPYVNARIGGVTCILVACTMSGRARVAYACFRFISTLYGAAVAVLVTAVVAKITQHGEKAQG